MLQYKRNVAQRDIVLNVDACVLQVFDLLCITILPIFDFQRLLPLKKMLVMVGRLTCNNLSHCIFDEGSLFDELFCSISMHVGRPVILKKYFFSSRPVNLSYAFFMPDILGLILMIFGSYMIMTFLVQSLITLCILLHIYPLLNHCILNLKIMNGGSVINHQLFNGKKSRKLFKLQHFQHLLHSLLENQCKQQQPLLA